MAFVERRCRNILVNRMLGPPSEEETIIIINDLDWDFFDAQEAIDRRDKAALRIHLANIIHTVARFDPLIYYDHLVEIYFPELREQVRLPEQVAEFLRSNIDAPAIAIIHPETQAP